MNTTESPVQRILIIDDSPEIQADYAKILNDQDCGSNLDALDAFLGETESAAQPIEEMPSVQLDTALQGQEGWEKVKKAIADGNPYAMAFVDMRMPPGWDGLKTIEEIWKVAPDLQIVICTAYSDNSWREILNRVGRTDKLLILKKPFDNIEVSQLVVALTEKWRLSKQARLRQEDLERLVEERTEQLRHLALHDPLTDLPNRMLFQVRLIEAINREARTGVGSSVILIDLDRFKQINDTLGHPVGDQLLIEVGRRLNENTRDTDTVARLGGDEFAVLRTDVENPLQANAAIEDLLTALQAPMQLADGEIDFGVSMGVSMLPQDGREAEELVRRADIALYRAKDGGRGQYRVFDEEMDAEVTEIRKIENDLKQAIRNEEFELHYQPLVDTATMEVNAVEALIRWRCPVRGLQDPGSFIQVAEDTGLVVPIGKWVIQQACRDAAKWPSKIKVSVNVSAVQFRGDELTSTVRDALNASGLSPSRLEIEITETVTLRESDQTIRILHELKEMGTSIVLDDFGIGFSSLSYLRRFPFDKMKLDKTFVLASSTCNDARAIVGAIANLGKNLGLATTAEGVETKEHWERAVREGFGQVQGFYFSEPVPVAEIGRFFHGKATPAVSAAAPVAMAGVSAAESFQGI